GFRWHPSRRTCHRLKNILPRCFLHTRDLPRQRHFTERYPRNTELPHIAFRPARQLATVVQTNRRRILRQFVERSVIASCFQRSAFLGILSYQLGTFYLTRLNAFFSHESSYFDF